MSHHDFTKELNESQLRAVSYCDGPLLVIAGAGSGKTRVLTYKIAYLLQNGYMPEEILSLTFTNKAAREMNGRIAQIVAGSNVHKIWSGTFHSIFSRILRRESEMVGYTPDYTIYDAADSKSLIKSIIKELELDDKTYKPSYIAYRISEAKNRLILPQAYGADSQIYKRDSIEKVPELRRIYSIYVEKCKRANAMDFDDLLLNTYLLFRNKEEVRRHYSDRFRYILVDEYQDTNYAQQQILSLLTINNKNICVVGDDAQSIYAFRGADISNILQFSDQSPTAKCVKLECNYRSTQNIVNAANSLIKHNVHQINKNVYSNNEEGERIQLLKCCSDKEECVRIAGEIRKLRNQTSISYDEIALLYRTNAQSRVFEEAFRQAHIPYRIYGGLSFYQRKEIKDIIAYLRLVCNSYDEEALKRIINYPTRGIGDTTIKKLQFAASEYGVSLWDILQSPDQFHVKLSKTTATKLYNFYELIEEFKRESSQTSAYELTIQVLKETGLAAEFAIGSAPEEISRRENVEELVDAIKSFEEDMREENGNEHITLADFLGHISLLTDSDKTDDDAPKVTLMTVHAAKGLEFDAVFICGMENELFPNANAIHNPREMEEERRLFYVAITRARKHCFVSFAEKRFKFGNIDYCTPSPFIKEINPKYISSTGEITANNWTNSSNYHQSTRFGNSSYTQNRQSYTQQPTHLRPITRTVSIQPAQDKNATRGGIKVGCIIEHERFGKGIVKSIEGSGESIKARVSFEHVGEKNLLLKFAKFRILAP